MPVPSSHPDGDPSGPSHPFRAHTANPQPNPPVNQDQPHSHSHYDFGSALQSRPASQTQSPYPINDAYFDEAFRATPSPQPTSFLDNILNPVESHTSSFGYYQVRESSPQRRRQSPSIRIPNTNMPPAQSSTDRSARLGNGYVDLTSTPDATEGLRASRRTRHSSPSPGPSSKRVKQNDGTPLKRETRRTEATVEEIDLSDDKQTVQDVLQKQREEAVKAQQKPEEKATTFNTFTCVICMDTPTDLTATACGMSLL